MKKSDTVITGIISVVLVLIVVLIVLFRVVCIRTVEGGTTGVKIKMGAVQEEVLANGWHIKVPFLTDIVKINNQVLRVDVDGESASKDLQTVQSTISVNYRVTPENSAYIYKNVGKCQEDWENIVLRPSVQEVVKSVVSKYTAEQLITDRQNVSSVMKEDLSNKAQSYGIEISAVNIINFNFSDEFNAAIEAKQTAQQNALKAEQDLERIKVESEQKIVEAEAEAKANQLKNQQITDETLKMAWIEKWDGKLPTVTSNASSLMDLASVIK